MRKTSCSGLKGDILKTCNRKNWEKVSVNSWKNKSNKKFLVINHNEITSFMNSKKFTNYPVIISNGKYGNTLEGSYPFKNKSQAVKWSKSYLEKH